MSEKVNWGSKPSSHELPANFKLSRFDVICARGKLALEHEGNIRMKALVQSCLPKYAQSTCKVEKSRIISSIVYSVRHGSHEGRFVKFVDDGWVCVDDRFAREKVGQIFRDQLHLKYRSSTKGKTIARMQQQSDSDVSTSASLPQANPAHKIPKSSTVAADSLLVEGAANPMPASANCIETTSTSSALQPHGSKPSQLTIIPQIQPLARTQLHPFLPIPPVQPTRVGSSNVLGQPIQCLDKTFEMTRLTFQNPTKTEIPTLSLLPTSHVKAAQTDLPAFTNPEVEVNLHDLEPLPIGDDLLDSLLHDTSAIFPGTGDAFGWES